MPKLAEPRFIESTAGEAATELARRGVAPNQRVTITIETALGTRQLGVKPSDPGMT